MRKATVLIWSVIVGWQIFDMIKDWDNPVLVIIDTVVAICATVAFAAAIADLRPEVIVNADSTWNHDDSK